MRNEIIGIDFGATFIKLAKVDLKGRILNKGLFATGDFGSRESLISAIVKEANSLIGGKRKNILGIGVGVPGQVDYKKGNIYNLTNVKGWHDVRLKDILKKRLSLPVFVDNDANVAASGEAEWGVARGFSNIVCVTLGSGVGGGIIIDGEVYHGRGYSAGEIGHICIERKGLHCNCGSFGCLETFAGNRYIVREVMARLKRGERSSLLKLAGGSYSKITPELIDKAAKQGDSFSLRIWKEVGYNVGIGLAGVVNILNPEIIVISGGLSKAGRVLFDNIRKGIQERAIPVFTKDLKIKRAKFVESAGVVGAAALVKKEFKATK